MERFMTHQLPYWLVLGSLLGSALLPLPEPVAVGRMASAVVPVEAMTVIDGQPQVVRVRHGR